MSGLLKRWYRRNWRADEAALARLPSGQPATLVTGASEGIGRALALQFAAAGNRLVLVARGEPGLRAVADEIRRSGAAEPLVLALDVSDPAAPALIAEVLRAEGLYLDVLVNNAGIGQAGPFAEAEPDRVEALVALNIAGLSRLMRAALPDMLVRGRGGVINVASLGGFVPGPHQAAYYASKAYVLSLTEAVAAECRGMGVRIMAVAPGPVDTRFHDKMGAVGAFYRAVGLTMRPEAVARSIRRGYAMGRTVIVPGFVPALLAPLARVMPHALIVPLLALLLRPRPSGISPDAQ